MPPPSKDPVPPKKPVPPLSKGVPPGKPVAGKLPADKAQGAAAGKKPASASKDKKPKGVGTGTRKLGQMLVDLGFLDEDQLWDLIEEAQTTKQALGQVAVGRGLVTEDQLTKALADQQGLTLVNLDDVKIQSNALSMIPETMATVYKVLPLSFENDVLTVVVGDPSNLAALDDLRNFLGLTNVQAVVAPPKALEAAIAKAYAGKEESIIDIIQALEADPDLRKHKRDTSIDLDSLMEIQDAAPVRKLINMVMLLAIQDKASDIHFEPFEEEFKMRYRRDGVLCEMVPPPRHLAMAIASRIKVMANLDIAERRLPQDGRIELNVGGNTVDMRVSVLPTMFGESVCIRVLDRTVVQLDLTKVGLEEKMLAQFREIIRKPNGIVLVTGPTGSGKTTTLYSALSELNVITDKLITTEDPVEYELDGICQCQINSDIDMTFAIALRAILRQDPDLILVGEIRDLETAQIAIQSALTGHMVFSTLHTNDAASTVTRLRDMGVEPFLITATIEAILAQRLVRRICTQCRTEFQPSADQLMELNLRPEDIKGKKIHYGSGCGNCNNTGFKGRCGLFELIVMNDALRDMISQRASTDEIQAYTRSKGVTSLRDSGLKALFGGVTTIDEVVRETILEGDV